MQMYFESWKYMFLRRSRNISTYIIFVGTFGGLAPQYQKAGYASGTSHGQTKLYVAV